MPDQQTSRRKQRRQAAFLRPFGAVGRLFSDAWRALASGDAWTRLSALVWGCSCIARRQFCKGLLLIAQEAAFIASLLWLLPSMRKLGTLGTVQAERVYDPLTRRNVWNDYDNSFLILLFGVTGAVIALLFAVQWLRNLRHAHQAQRAAQEGRRLASFREDLAVCLGAKFHWTLLSLPVLGVTLLTILPLLVMIAIAFTNYDRNHLVPTNLFTWVGLDNFRSLVDLTGSGSFGYAFWNVLAWTLVWAVLASLSCYILGILMAMLISHRDTRGKRFWRTCFMVAMAVPQFVSLLLVRNFFADVGIVNTFCKNIGLTDWLYGVGAIPTANVIPFLTHPSWARPMILLINVWVGVPYQMLIATGILMNIPGELIEAAQIDGAGAFARFRHITMPYILFITGPSLVSSIVSNINNFNVIWLLSRDVYTTGDQMMANAGATEVDLLVTWLYRLTQDQSNYKMASVIGILVFLVCAALTLVTFSRLTGGKREEGFQ